MSLSLPRTVGILSWILAAACTSNPVFRDGDLPYTVNFESFDVGRVADNGAVDNLFISKDWVPKVNEMLLGVTRKRTDGWEVLIEPNYLSLTPLSDKWAIGYRHGDKNRLRLLDLTTGQERDLPVAEGGVPVISNWKRLNTTWSTWNEGKEQKIRKRVWILSSPDKEGRSQALLLDSDGKYLSTVTDLRPVGKWRDRVLTDAGKYIILDSSNAKGEAVCSTRTRDGNLLAKEVAPIERFPLGRTEAHGNFDVEVVEDEYVIAVGELSNTPNSDWDWKGEGLFLQRIGQKPSDRLRYWDPRIYHPLDEQGVPLPLPLGVVGLMRITTHVPDVREGRWRKAHKEYPQGYHSGWVVLFGTTEGKRQFGFAKGSARHALRIAGQLNRYDEWEQAGLHRFAFEGSWRPARAFARRAGDLVWETIDLETMDPYAQEGYGKASPWGRELTDSDLPSLKHTNFGLVDPMGQGLAIALTKKERESAQQQEEEERRILEAQRKERLDACFAAIVEGNRYTANSLLTNWDLGPGERGAWVSFYGKFGCRDSYELARARELGMDQERLEQVALELDRRVAQQEADAQSIRDAQAARAAWSTAMSRPIMIEKIEIEHLPGGKTLVRRRMVPLH